MSDDKDPPLIDHNPHEKRQTNAIWWVLWPAVALLWVAGFYFEFLDRTSILLGLGTGAMLATWAIEITGNKVPESWRKAAGGR